MSSMSIRWAYDVFVRDIRNLIFLSRWSNEFVKLTVGEWWWIIVLLWFLSSKLTRAKNFCLITLICTVIDILRENTGVVPDETTTDPFTMHVSTLPSKTWYFKTCTSFFVFSIFKPTPAIVWLDCINDNTKFNGKFLIFVSLENTNVALIRSVDVRCDKILTSMQLFEQFCTMFVSWRVQSSLQFSLQMWLFVELLQTTFKFRQSGGFCTKVKRKIQIKEFSL